MTGKVDSKRKQLEILLRSEDADGSTDVETKEGNVEVCSDEEGDASDEECTDREDSAFNTLNVGDIVEVYWKGMKKWYEGEVTDKDDKDDTVEIHYKEDGQKLYHSLDTYRMRLLE